MSPAAHDVIALTDHPDGAVIECACGRVFTGALGDCRARHAVHHGLEMARSALRKDTDGS